MLLPALQARLTVNAERVPRQQTFLPMSRPARPDPAYPDPTRPSHDAVRMDAFTRLRIVSSETNCTIDMLWALMWKNKDRSWEHKFVMGAMHAMYQVDGTFSENLMGFKLFFDLNWGPEHVER